MDWYELIFFDRELPPYSRVRGYYVINTQYDLLVRWVERELAPPTAPKLEFTQGETPVIARDARASAARQSTRSSLMR
jgi:hypothetical protein